MKKLFFPLIIPLSLFSQQLTVSIDSTVYDFQTTVTLKLNPLNYFSNFVSWGCLRKGTNDIDIFTSTGKTNTIRAPASMSLSARSTQRIVVVSQTYINNDSLYEFLLINLDSLVSLGYNSALYDNSGKRLWSEKGYASLEFDGKNTFIYIATTSTVKIWVFRTDIAASSPLAKTSSNRYEPFINYLPMNGLNIKIDFSNHNTAFVQLFDMLGRLVYSQAIEKNSTIIQRQHIPLSPFFAKINYQASEKAGFIVPVK